MAVRAALAILVLLVLAGAGPRALNERRAELSETEAEARATSTAIALITDRIAANEVKVVTLQARLAELDQLRAGQLVRLAGRQDEVLHLLAALQTLSRRPPALMLAQPQSAVD